MPETAESRSEKTGEFGRKGDQVNRKVAVFVTGGTIVCSYDPVTGKARPAYHASELIDKIDGMHEGIDIELFEPCNVQGTELTLEKGLDVAVRIRDALKDDTVAGAVIVQGTDTLDEMSYFYDLIIDSDKPVVLTGSMKCFGELYSDMLGNLLGAVLVAGDPGSRGKGTMVFFNETVFSAADINKENANRIDAFQSYAGPLGILDNKIPVFYRKPKEAERYEIDRICGRVEIIKACVGMGTRLLEYAVASKPDGIVLEAFGSGNIPSWMVPAVEKAIRDGIHVIISTRCFSGLAKAGYDYEGGGTQLEDIGAVFAGRLSSQKARIRLIVLLSAGRTPAQIREAFKER